MNKKESIEKFGLYESGSVGTEAYYRSTIFTGSYLLHTSGVQEMCGELSCFWVMDCIASYLNKISKSQEYFFVIHVIKELETDGCYFLIDDLNKNIVKQKIPYTDLPINLKLYLQCDNGKWVTMMPSEY